MINVELRDLRIVIALAGHGSLVRAARVLGMSQSALTRALSGIETKLGAKLFDRAHRGLAQTEACRAIVAAGNEILSQLDQLGVTVSQLRGGKSAPLTVGSGHFPMEAVMAPAAARFLEVHPNIQLIIKNGPPPNVLRDLQERRVELIVVELSDIDGPEEFNIEPLRRHPVMLMARPDHPLLQLGRPPEVHEIFAFPSTTAPYMSARAAIPLSNAREAARPLDPHPQFPAVVIQAVSECMAVAARSLAVAPATAPSAELWAQNGALSVLPFAAPWLTTNFGILSLRNRPLSEGAKTFIELIKDADAEAYEAALRLAPDIVEAHRTEFAMVGSRGAPAAVRCPTIAKM